MDVLIAGGGTGGHLFPGIAVAQEIRRRDPSARILFVGSPRGVEVRAVPQAGFDLALLPVEGLRGKKFGNLLRGLVTLPWALWRALLLVRRFKPQLSVSVGGYAAGPAVLASRLCGVPCVVMEQNTVPGITNRILSRFARRVILALPSTHFPAHKAQVLGNPVRATFQKVRTRPFCPQRPLRLLVVGGSQGAHFLNQLLLQVCERFVHDNWDIQVLHQTGKKDFHEVQAAYAKLPGQKMRAVEFIDDMATAYEQADLLLCRSGASTLSEVTVCGRPSILVPFPAAVDDHQTLNAQVLVRAGAAVCVQQRDMTAERLLQLLQEFLKDPTTLQHMAQAAWSLGKPDAVEVIANSLEQEAAHV